MLDFVQIAPFDEGDKFIPFGVRQPNRVRILTDYDFLIGDHDFWTFRTKRTQRQSDGFHRGLP
jgi:hypothetical protein